LIRTGTGPKISGFRWSKEEACGRVHRRLIEGHTRRADELDPLDHALVIDVELQDDVALHAALEELGRVVRLDELDQLGELGELGRRRRGVGGLSREGKEREQGRVRHGVLPNRSGDIFRGESGPSRINP
jgi:hypothetical protein